MLLSSRRGATTEEVWLLTAVIEVVCVAGWRRVAASCFIGALSAIYVSAIPSFFQRPKRCRFLDDTPEFAKVVTAERRNAWFV